MGDAAGKGLDELPLHLLQRILLLGRLRASDLACLETSCYTFRAAAGAGLYRFKSVIESAAVQCCQSDPLFCRIPGPLQSQLVNRCGGNWKLVLRFLQAIQEAADGFSTAPGKRIQVVAGKYLTFFIDAQGKLFGCGSNQFGVLAQGYSALVSRTPLPIPVPDGLRVAQVSGTHHHVAWFTESGLVFTYGDNSSGCCGHGHVGGPVYQPTLVESLRDIPCKQVSTGLSFTAALTREGQLYTWGSASHGQLGHGDTVERSQPVLVETLTTIGPVVQIATGTSYTLAVMDHGDLYSFGYGANNCLGHDDFASEWQPRLVLSLQEKGTCITSVAAGDEHSVAIDSLGYVYTWGKGYCGALGHGDEVDVPRPKIVSGLKHVLAVHVSTRRRKTFVIADTGELFMFGWMALGSLGLTDRGGSDKVLEPMALPEHHIAYVSAGCYHTVAITNHGMLLSFGDNEVGQLGFDSEFAQRLRDS